MPFRSLLVPLDPLIEKTQLQNLFVDSYNANDFDEEIIYDYRESYFLTKIDFLDSVSKIKNRISEFVNLNAEDKISPAVYNQSVRIIDALSPSLWDKIGDKNIYASSYGTLIFDWEKSDDDIFSLEVGNKSFGYFIENNGKDVKQVDQLMIDDKFEKQSVLLLEDLSQFIDS